MRRKDVLRSIIVGVLVVILVLFDVIEGWSGAGMLEGKAGDAIHAFWSSHT